MKIVVSLPQNRNKKTNRFVIAQIRQAIGEAQEHLDDTIRLIDPAEHSLSLQGIHEIIKKADLIIFD